MTNGPSPAAAQAWNAGARSTAGGIHLHRLRPGPRPLARLPDAYAAGPPFPDGRRAAPGRTSAPRSCPGNRDSAAFVSVIEIPAGTPIEQYVALQWAFSGTRDAFETNAAFAGGVSRIVIDGGTGTERVEAGDMLDIGGTDYEVEDATENPAGTWTVDLTTALQANVANNTAVTLTGDNTALRINGCLYRN